MERTLERLLADRNSALSAALIRIRALAGERRKDPDMAFILETASNALGSATAAPAAATTIAAAFERWHELMMANFPTDAEGVAAADERLELEDRIISTRARVGGDVLVKATMLREHAKALWGRTDEILVSIAADLESLTGKGGAS